MNETEFQSRVAAALAPHSAGLTGVLRQLVGHTYPSEVKCLSFAVFCSEFTRGFPVRAFFLDDENTEFFLFEGDEARYPSPVDPGLLKLASVYDEQLEAELEEAIPDSDPWTLAGLSLVNWFAACWKDAGGITFPLDAVIQLHGDLRHFDLRAQEWQGE